jgi:hypothetical protein
VTTEYQYLGLMVDKAGLGRRAREELVAAANRQLWAKWRLIGQMRGMPVKGKVRVWQAMVQTILEQGAEVMRDSVWVEAERVLLKMGRLILGVGGVSITDEVVRGELGLWRVIARRWRKRLVYWMCIVREEVPALVRTWYGVSRYMNEHKGVKNWCEDTKRILEWLGMGELWENEAEVGKEEWKRVVCRKIHEYEWEEWRKGIEKKQKLAWYGRVKEGLWFEGYLENFDWHGRRSLCLLRAGCLRLREETGRWVGEAREQRVCRCCNMGM